MYASRPDAVREVAQALGRPASPLGSYHFPNALHARIRQQNRKARREA